MGCRVNPFYIEGPAHISTSGGLTSGYMLRRVIDAHGGKLPPDVHALFCNTGKEREETLDFVHEIETRWNVPIVWLEYVAPSDVDGAASFVETSFERASRKGEPFDALIAHRSRINEHGATLPNVVAAWCSSELKQRTMKRWMEARGHDEWTSVVGLRADERVRVARMRGRKLEGGHIELPLADAGISVGDVREYWRTSCFTLKLRAYEGNCDLCFKKGRRKIETIMREHPETVPWWADHERRAGTVFRQDRPTYKRLLKLVESQQMLDIDLDGVDDDSLPCACTD